MMDSIVEIRRAEAQSHTQIYTEAKLFQKGSWLHKPVQAVLDVLPQFDGYTSFRGLDLGCGIGRNCIPVAEHFKNVNCRIDCVDILPLAIEKLQENAVGYDVVEHIHGIVSSIDDYEIEANTFDLILAISALEHVDSEAAFVDKLHQIRDGLRNNGVAILLLNTNVQETDKCTGEKLQPQFEVNWNGDSLVAVFDEVFGCWRCLRHTTVHQKYDIPRGETIAVLDTDVVTYIVRKT